MLSSLSRYLRVAVQAARRAGALLARHAGEPAIVETKRSAIDLVTNIDRAAETMIHRTLLRAFPDHGFYGEEHATLRKAAPYQWIVDPIDGTTNFVHGVPLFGVSIALVHHGTGLLGVVYDPIRKELFTATQGGGAFLNGTRLRVSGTRRLAKSLLSTGFASTFANEAARHLRWFRAFESNSHAVRRIGTTVLSLAYVASGRMDGFYEQHLWPWDMAAGLLLVREAGGRTTNFRGTPPVLAHGEVVASNGRIHREMLAMLAHRPRRRGAGRRGGAAGRRRVAGRR